MRHPPKEIEVCLALDARKIESCSTTVPFLTTNRNKFVIAPAEGG